jgi:hypothetical protein
VLEDNGLLLETASISESSEAAARRAGNAAARAIRKRASEPSFRALADAKIIAQSGPLLSNRSVASFAAGSTRRAFERPLTVYVRPHGVDRMATGPKGRKRPAAAAATPFTSCGAIWAATH